jgi:hypothetical protein
VARLAVRLSPIIAVSIAVLRKSGSVIVIVANGSSEAPSSG